MPKGKGSGSKKKVKGGSKKKVEGEGTPKNHPRANPLPSDNNKSVKSPPTPTDKPSAPPTNNSLYLLYESFGAGRRDRDDLYSLYKIDMDSNATPPNSVATPPNSVAAPTETNLTPFVTETNLTPFFTIPRKENLVIERSCARIGSKLYFVGGAKKDDEGNVEFLREVYVLDLLTKVYRKMNACLNAGKPEPCLVFAVNGLLFALGSLPAVPSEQLSGMKLFEYLDPNTNKWEVIEELPLVNPQVKHVYSANGLLLPKFVPKGIDWTGFILLKEGKEVVLLGSEVPGVEGRAKWVRYVYTPMKKWSDSTPSKLSILGFVEGHDKECLYGLSFMGGPIKFKLGLMDEMNWLGCNRYRFGDEAVHMSNSGTPMLKGEDLAEWVRNYFCMPYIGCETRLLHYLGDGYFIYIASGMVPYDGEDPDPSKRGITITLFKEENQGDIGEKGKKVCFDARILSSKSYVDYTPGVFNEAKLIECFVVPSQEKVQQKKKKKQQLKEKKIVQATV